MSRLGSLANDFTVKRLRSKIPPSISGWGEKVSEETGG